MSGSFDYYFFFQPFFFFFFFAKLQALAIRGQMFRRTWCAMSKKMKCHFLSNDFCIAIRWFGLILQ